MNIIQWGGVEPSSSRRRIVVAILGVLASVNRQDPSRLSGFPRRKFEPGQRVRFEDDRTKWKEGVVIAYWWGHPLYYHCDQWVYQVLIISATYDEHLGQGYTQEFEEGELMQV